MRSDPFPRFAKIWNLRSCFRKILITSCGFFGLGKGEFLRLREYRFAVIA